MILRRLAQSLKEQNWTAICVEFVLLVLGVFLGIQAANWNQSLADERKCRVYAVRLTSDLEKDLASKREIVAYYAAVLDSVERTDALLTEPQADPQALVVSAYRASEIVFQPSSRATWDEIISSGDIGLLPRDVANRAAEYFAFDSAEDVLGILDDSVYRHRVRTTIPLAVQKALRAGCSDIRNEAQQITGFMPDCALELAPGVIEETAAALREDPTVLASLRYQYSDVYSAHANIQGDVVAIERTLEALNERSINGETAQ